LREAPKVQLANTERVVWCSRRNNAACQYAIEKLPEDLQTAIGKRMSFADPAPDNSDRAIPYEIRDYPELMDWSGLAVVEGKCAGIRANLPSAGFLADMAVVVIAVCYFGQAATRGRTSKPLPGPLEGFGSALVHHVLDGANDCHHHTAADAATSDLSQNRPDTGSRVAVDSTTGDHTENLAAETAAEDTGDGVAQRAERQVLEQAARDIAPNGTRDELNDDLFHAYISLQFI